MKMPTTTNVKVETKVSTEVGDATKQCINCLEKKVRNLEKRKSRIEQNQEKAKKGSKLEKEQEISLHQYEQVSHDLEFARELHKQFIQIYAEHEKMAKKQAKREKAERQAQEIKRVGEILQLQSLLDLLGGDKVREDFKTGKHGAVVLSEDNLNQLDELYQAISPSRDESGYSQRLTTAAEHLVAIVDGKDRQVAGTTYKEIKELITLISECGYFEKVTTETKGTEDVEVTDEQDEEDETELVSEPIMTEPSLEDITEKEDQQAVLNEQQPIDLTVEPTDVVQSPQDMPSQHLNTVDQDAFFGPNSAAYQVEQESHFSQQSHTTNTVQQQVSASSSRQVPDFQSFTDNRPFQFIQNSYIMPEVGADPAVIAAQPAGSSSLQFMSQSFEPSSTQQQPQQAQVPNQPQQQQQTDLTQQPVLQQHQSQDFSSQSYAQAGLRQTDGRYQPGPSALPVEEVAIGGALQSRAATTAAGIMAPMGESAAVLSSHTAYEIPPSIPMPPSKQLQDQNQLDQQTQQQQEKKFQMNANAQVFQSMYPQQVAGQGGPGMSVPPPTVPVTNIGGMTTDQLSQQQSSDFATASIQGPPPGASIQTNGDYGSQSGGSGDFQQPYSGNSFGGFNRGGRGGFRGRGGSGGNGGSRNGGGGMQNGYNNRGGQGNSGRGGRGGNYQGYQPNTSFRSDSYQGNYNAGSSNGGGFGNQVYSKRGGSGGGMPGNNGNQGGGQGYSRGGGMGRGGSGGMRGGMQRGGGPGAPRGAPRGGQFNRPTAAQ